MVTLPAGHLEGVARDPFTAGARNHHLRLRGLAIVDDAGIGREIGALRVLANGNDVDVFEAGLGARHGDHGPNVGVEIELLAQRHVDGTKTLAHRRGQRPLEADPVAGDGLERRVRNQVTGAVEGHQAGLGAFVLQSRVHRVEHTQRGVHDFGTDAVTGDDRNGGSHCRKTPA